MKIIIALLLPLFMLATGCVRETGKNGASSVNKTSGSNSSIPVITWEFNTEETESGPETTAIMVVHDNPEERHVISTFSGGKDQVTVYDYNAAERKAGAQTMNTVAGFKTFLAGKGQEVVVLYDEHYRALEVTCMWFDEKDDFETDTSVIKTVPLKDHAADTGL